MRRRTSVTCRTERHPAGPQSRSGRSHAWAAVTLRGLQSRCAGVASADGPLRCLLCCISDIGLHGRPDPGNRSFMPGQRNFGGRRARGSWTLRIAGIIVVILLAAGAVIASLVAARPRVTRSVRALSATVQTIQTTGLVNPGPPAGGTAAAAAPQMLLISPAGLAFGPIPPSELVTGAPQWSADLMAGGTYIFIYAPTGQCLASVGPPRAPALAARRCDLGRSQRWRTAGTGIQTGGHYYGQFSNLASGRGLSAGGAMPSAGHGDSAAALAPCGPAQPWRQLISFWWAS